MPVGRDLDCALPGALARRACHYPAIKKQRGSHRVCRRVPHQHVRIGVGCAGKSKAMDFTWPAKRVQPRAKKH